MATSLLGPLHHPRHDIVSRQNEKQNIKKRNSLAHPRPGHHHPPDLVLLRARFESDEVDEGAGLVGRGGFL
jgi:hypothetical protein